MATTTTNLGLTKPSYVEDADIAVINANMDTIDSAFGELRTALNAKVPLTGGTMTGALQLKTASIDRDGANPSSAVYPSDANIVLVDKDGERIGLIRCVEATDGRIGLQLCAVGENSGGSEVSNAIYLYVAKDGTATYSVQNQTNFRSAIGAFSTGGGNITGDTSLSSGKILTVDKVLSRTRSISYIAGANGNAALYAPKTRNADAWYPAVCLDTKSGGSWQMGNYNNEYLQFVYATQANRASGTNSTTAVNLRNVGGTVALSGERQSPRAWTYLKSWTGSAAQSWDAGQFVEILVIARYSTSYVGSIIIQRDHLDGTVREHYLTGGYNGTGYSGRACALNLSQSYAKGAIRAINDSVSYNCDGTTFWIYGR